MRGHTLPEETGASRLASTLMAFTYSHTYAHTCMHAASQSWRTPIPQGRGTSENTAPTLISYLYILSCTLQSYLPRPASYTILFMDSPPPPHASPLPLSNPICVPPPPACRCHPSKRLPTGCVSCDPDECVSVCVCSPMICVLM